MSASLVTVLLSFTLGSASARQQGLLARAREGSRYMAVEANMDVYHNRNKFDLKDGDERFDALWSRHDNENRLTKEEARELYVPRRGQSKIGSQIYYGQYMEDEYLNRKYFKNKRGGTFVEMGGFNGITFSNSLFYEEQLGWKGLLVEPSPKSYNMLRFNRPAAETVKINKAVCEKPTKIKMKDESNLANEAVGANVKRNFGLQSKDVDVDCIPLTSMLHTAGITQIDFFSLDVEGLEMQALRSMDWNVPVHTWMIETVTALPTAYAEAGDIKGGTQRYHRDLHEMMLSKGYRCDVKYAPNEVWVNDNFPSKPKVDAGRVPLNETCRVACGLEPKCNE